MNESRHSSIHPFIHSSIHPFILSGKNVIAVLGFLQKHREVNVNQIEQSGGTPWRKWPLS